MEQLPSRDLIKHLHSLYISGPHSVVIASYGSCLFTGVIRTGKMTRFLCEQMWKVWNLFRIYGRVIFHTSTSKFITVISRKTLKTDIQLLEHHAPTIWKLNSNTHSWSVSDLINRGSSWSCALIFLMFQNLLRLKLASYFSKSHPCKSEHTERSAAQANSSLRRGNT